MKRKEATDEMASEVIGFVASGSKPFNMRFYSMQQINVDCVVVELNEIREKIVYEVTDVDVYNSRMEDVELVRYILPGEDYTQYNIYRATAKPLGIIKENEVISMKRWFIAPPGMEVKKAESQEIALVYGVEQCDGKQKIGSILRHEQIPVWINAADLLTTHMAMVGRSGQGKSNLAKILLNKLPMKYMVFTKVNEYTNIENAESMDIEKVSVPMDINLMRKIFELSNTEVQHLREFLKSAKCPRTVQSHELAENIRQFFGTVPDENFEQISIFGSVMQGKNAQLPKFVESLCTKMESTPVEFLSGESIEEDSQSCIVNMQRLSAKEEEIVLYTYLAPILEGRSKCYKNTEQPIPLNERIVIFIEESHNYIPSTKSTFCKELIRSIAREGRKLGIHLVLLSQRPRHIDPTALSQCGSVISFNLTNPEDIDYLMQNANFYGDYYRNTISELKIGECTIVSDYLKKAINCKVDYK